MRAAPLASALALVLAVTFAGGPARSDGTPSEAVAPGDSSVPSLELEATQTQLLARADQHPESYSAQLNAAEGLLRLADRLRNERKIRSDLGRERDKEYRAQQATWAEQAIPAAQRALDLARDDAQRAQAERVLGELYSHRITGMISGMINGPRAKRHIGRALELEPTDPECNRAIGLMYLHNPPITGGNLTKAIETFERCAKEIPDERCLVLLAMAHRKDGNLVAAREAAQAALARNPESVDAQLLLQELR